MSKERDPKHGSAPDDAELPEGGSPDLSEEELERMAEEPLEGEGERGSDPPKSGAPVDGAAGTSDEDGVIVDDVDLKEALRGALRRPPGAVSPPLLRGVQKRLRVRSKGKFYGDGWSTAEAPRSTYLVTSALMLVIMLLILLSLIPWDKSVLP